MTYCQWVRTDEGWPGYERQPIQSGVIVIVRLCMGVWMDTVHNRFIDVLSSQSVSAAAARRPAGATPRARARRRSARALASASEQ